MCLCLLCGCYMCVCLFFVTYILEQMQHPLSLVLDWKISKLIMPCAATGTRGQTTQFEAALLHRTVDVLWNVCWLPCAVGPQLLCTQGLQQKIQIFTLTTIPGHHAMYQYTIYSKCSNQMWLFLGLLVIEECLSTGSTGCSSITLWIISHL